VAQVKGHPRPALFEPGPHRGAPRHLAPARKSAPLSGAPRAEQASAAGSAHCEYVYTNPWHPAASSVATPARPLQPGRPRRGGGRGARRGKEGRLRRPTTDRPQQQRRQRPSAAPSPSPVRRQQQRSSSSSPGQQRQQRRSFPSPSSSSSISTPAELLLQPVRREPIHPRAAASRPQSSRLDRQPTIFRVRRLPDGTPFAGPIRKMSQPDFDEFDCREQRNYNQQSSPPVQTVMFS
jgi:hypothetical protein